MVIKLCMDILHSKLVIPIHFWVSRSRSLWPSIWKGFMLKILCKLVFTPRPVTFKLVLPREFGVNRSKVTVTRLYRDSWWLYIGENLHTPRYIIFKHGMDIHRSKLMMPWEFGFNRLNVEVMDFQYRNSPCF